MLTWWNKEQNIITSVDPIQQLNLCSNIRKSIKNTLESRQIFTQLITIHYRKQSSNGGFDLRTGRNLGKERNGATQLLQYIAPTENNGFAQLYAYDPQHTSHKTSDEDIYLNMDHEMQMGTNFDYLFFQSSRFFQASEMQLLKNQCEQERLQILTIVMFSLEKSRLAGYMLTGNRSMILETDFRLAWM